MSVEQDQHIRRRSLFRFLLVAACLCLLFFGPGCATVHDQDTWNTTTEPDWEDWTVFLIYIGIIVTAEVLGH